MSDKLTLKLDGDKIESVTVATKSGPIEVPFIVEKNMQNWPDILEMVNSIDWSAIKAQTIRKVVVGDVSKKVVSSRRTHQRLTTIHSMKNINIKKEIVVHIREEIGDGVVTARKIIEVLKGCPHLTHLKESTYLNYGYTYYKYFITRNKLDDDGKFKKLELDPIDEDAVRKRANDERKMMQELVKR